MLAFYIQFQNLAIKTVPLCECFLHTEAQLKEKSPHGTVGANSQNKYLYKSLNDAC